MDRVPASDLKLGDVVLLEVFVTRWQPKEDDNVDDMGASASNRRTRVPGNSKWGKKDWKKWNVQFTLDAISLIYPGSAHYVEEKKPDEDVEL